MTWRPPNELERLLLADTRACCKELIPLARVLALAPRIEPLLLRNARHRFLPGTGAEIESQLWFSPLVAARSTREIVLHLGIARVLAGQLGGAQPWPDDPCRDGDPDGAGSPGLDDVWAFTREHTRHWPREDRLERDLRYHALRGDDEALAGGLRAILARIAAESGPEVDETRRIGLSRLAKRTLPTIRPGLGTKSVETARLLSRYAALALGDAGDWSAEPGAPEALPPWLSQRLPPPLAQSRLGVEIRWDKEHGQALHLVEPRQGEPAIDLPSPLPARLHVAPGGEVGKWHAVTRGTRIPIDTPSAVFRLTTLDGRQWDLATDALPEGAEVATKAGPPPLQLIHIRADREVAHTIAEWLRGQGIPVDLVTESTPRRDTAPQPGPARALRLWTRAARDLWAQAGAEPPQDPARGLLLRIDDAEPPAGGVAAGRLLDWLDWQRLGESPRSGDLLGALERWWQEGEVPRRAAPTAIEQANVPVRGDTQLAEDVASDVTVGKEQHADTERLLAEIVEIWPLLAELRDPATEPPRRLEIGDRLAELGDTRPGVGTVEIEVPVDEEPASATETVAAVAAGHSFFDRENEREDLWRLLEGDHVVLSGPRRLGKTSILQRLADEAADKGLIARLVDVGGLDTPAAFIEALHRAFPDATVAGHLREAGKTVGGWLSRLKKVDVKLPGGLDGGIEMQAPPDAAWSEDARRLQERLGKTVGGWLSRLKKVDVKLPGGLGGGIEMQAPPDAAWSEDARRLQERLSAAPVLLLIDEVSVFLEKSLARDHSDTVKLLSWLRAWRQQSALVCRFLFSGSVGLNALLARHGLATYFNDCYDFRLGPFKERAALDMLTTECEREGWVPEPGTLTYLCGRVGWLSPFYLNLLLDSALSAARDRRQETGAEDRHLLDTDVDGGYDRLITVRSRFIHWYQRLERDLSPPDLVFALRILGAVAGSDQGLTRRQLLARLSKIEPDPDRRTARLDTAMLSLEEDGYLDAAGERIQFSSFLLRDYWRHNHGR